MSKDTIFSTLRAVLNAAGMLLVGRHIFAHVVLSFQDWQVWVGAFITIVSTIWGIVDKSAGIDQVESASRSVLQGVGGFLIGAGLVKSETMEAISGIVGVLIAALQSQTSKVKVKQIIVGQVKPATDGKVVDMNIPIPLPPQHVVVVPNKAS